MSHRHSHAHNVTDSALELPPTRRRRTTTSAPSEPKELEGRNRTPMSFSTTDSFKAKLRAEAKRVGGSISGVINAALQQYFQTLMSRSSWETDDETGSGYNRQRFYTASDDSKGHSAQIRLYVPKGLAGQIARIVNSGEIPEYRSAADFYRDALMHRAFEVGGWIDDEKLVAEVDLLVLLSEEHQIQQVRADVDKLCTAMETNINDGIERGDWTWLKAYIAERKEKADSIPEMHRDKFLVTIDNAEEKINKASKRRR